jgi:hypothetical protein
MKRIDSVSLENGSRIDEFPELLAYATEIENGTTNTY